MKKLIIWFFFFTSLLFADIVIPAGNVSGIWTQANSPYYIDGEITLQLSDNLTIQPGVQVVFNGYYKFIIHGKLLAQGTPADSILFTVADTTGFSNYQTTDGGWHGLRFMSCIYNGQGNSKLEHCRIEYAKSSDYNAPYADRCGGGIYINLSSNLEITNCEISNNAACYGGGIYIWESSPILSGLTIKRNHARSDGGGMIFSGENTCPTLESSTILNNSCNYDGGGIYFCSGSVPIISNVTITGNSCLDYEGAEGGGISCWGANPVLNNVSIIENFSVDNGGGISCSHNSSIIANNLIIYRNIAEWSGGGICVSNTTINLSGVTISENVTSGNGGGIYFGHSAVAVFDPVNRCNIYCNIDTNNNIGNDLSAYNLTDVDVIVDTFTVMIPNNYYSYPLENFTFDILNAKIEQIYDDLFVSPAGSDGNSGLTPDDPFLTITHALSMIAADSLEAHTIHLANGIYSPSQTGETFPVVPHNYISIVGTQQDSVVLDGESADYLIIINGSENVTAKNLTLKNFTYNAIRLEESNATIENLIITENELSYYSAIHSSGSEYILNRVLLYDNQYEVWSVVIESSDDNLSILNSTFYNNEIGTGGSCIDATESNVSIVNSIFYNCGNTICRSLSWSPSFLNITYCDIENGIEAIVVDFGAELNWLDGNIDADPLFVDPNTGDFNLSENSPCIDAGTAYFEWNGEVILDMDENEYYGNAPDMGALEWFGTPVSDELEVVSYELCNFPNPFNPDTKIQFSIPIDSKVELAVYNIKGQKVKQLINDQLAAGQHSVVWNGTDESGKQSASGIYFCKVKAEVEGKTKFEKTRKMMLLK
ncbi:MAG: right-handed parallel beta-helix repeat-containing protein [Candidatus Cloacimonadales bacterium]|nr:right-handed parallel beta-helix repeat-containing protein [Candidatus Cloacimonadales bacterium]